jgi:hypothetical protein
MSDFEFLSVLVSIVIGLGLTHLLSGLGRAFYARELYRLDPVHVAWTITILFLLVLNWWVFLLWREFDRWTFAVFFTTVIWTTSMYMLAVILYPPNLPDDAKLSRGLRAEPQLVSYKLYGHVPAGPASERPA